MIAGLLGNPVVHLHAIHSQRPVVVENEAIESENTAWIREQRRLSLLHGEFGKEIVGGERNSVSGKAPLVGNAADSPVNRLRQQRHRGSRKVDGLRSNSEAMGS